MRIGVIADDLTGANDTAVQFAKQGLKTIVLIDFESNPQANGDWDVVVIDTCSRSDAAKTAYEKARRATRFLQESGAQLFYKKIDSTLRGNIGSELNAVMDELNANLSFVVPAFPATGRITLGGYQLVNGRLLENTEVAHDPLFPVKESHVPTLIGRQTGRKTTQMGLNKIRGTLDDLSNGVRELRTQGFEIIVFDAVTQEDLARIALLQPCYDDLKVVCGPAGFAEELAKTTVTRKETPTLTVAGSLSQVTAKQVEKLKLQPRTVVVEPDLAEITRSEPESKQREEIVNEGIKALSEGHDLVIRPKDCQASRRALDKALTDLGEDRASAASRVILVLGRITMDIMKNSKIAGLVLTGGDTARGVCRSMRINTIEIDDEVLPGVPSGVVVKGEYEGLRIVTKAGSFGEEDALVESVRFLKRRSRSTAYRTYQAREAGEDPR